jgi:hypothetical protein
MCIGNTTSPAANSTINWYPREEERVTTLQGGPQMGDTPGRDSISPTPKKSSGPKPAKQSSKY